MRPPRLVLNDAVSVPEARERLTELGLSGAPLTDGNRTFRGSVDIDQLVRADPEASIRSIGDGNLSAVPEEATLDAAVEIFATEHVTWVPVLDADRRVVGTVGTADLVAAYRRSLASSLESLGSIFPGSVLVEEEVHPESAVTGRAIGDAGWPSGTVVVAIQRDDQLLFPEPKTVISDGDVISVFVPARGETLLRQAVGAPPPRESVDDSPMI